MEGVYYETLGLLQVAARFGMGQIFPYHHRNVACIFQLGASGARLPRTRSGGAWDEISSSERSFKHRPYPGSKGSPGRVFVFVMPENGASDLCARAGMFVGNVQVSVDRTSMLPGNFPTPKRPLFVVAPSDTWGLLQVGRRAELASGIPDHVGAPM